MRFLCALVLFAPLGLLLWWVSFHHGAAFYVPFWVVLVCAFSAAIGINSLIPKETPD